MSFDGVDDYISLPDVVDSGLTSGFTISTWVKVINNSSYPTFISLSKNIYTIISAEDNASGNKFKFGINDGGGSWHFMYGSTITLGDWYHIIGTWDGVTAKLYMNGTLYDTALVSSYNPINRQNVLGAWANGATTQASYLNGILDEVRIYSRALSASEIKLIYNMGK